MKLTTVPPNIHQPARPNDDLSLVIQQQDWLKTISMGQIIKGKVLKVYDGNRYGIMMGGHERVVDSTIQFQVGQQLSAKVTNIHGEKVSLKLTERVASDQAASANAVSIGSQATSQSLVENMASQFNLRLTDLQKQSIDGLARVYRQDPFAIKVALYLAKMGLPIAESLIRDVIKNAHGSTQPIKLEAVVAEAKLIADADSMPALYQAIAAAFSGDGPQEDDRGEAHQDAMSEPTVSDGYAPGLRFEQHASGFDEEAGQMPFMKLFNIDTEGAIAHSFDVLSIIINDRLLEFDVAFFDQAHMQSGTTSSKQVVFELDTQSGKVGVVAKLVNNRLSLAFNTEQPTLMAALQQQKDAFSETLSQAGWVLERAHYTAQAGQASAMTAIIDHVLAQGSLEKVL